MSLVPIKLLKNKVNRTRLLGLKGETEEIDKEDFIESRINTNAKAKNLLAIEDASEMAKLYLHKKGVFEKIAKDIQSESKKKFKFYLRKTNAMEKRPFPKKDKVGTAYMLVEHSYPDGSGHYGMAVINHNKKVAKVFDSMTNQESDFEPSIKSTLGKGYTVALSSIYGCLPRLKNDSKGNLMPQPTGGFVTNSFDDFKKTNFAGGRGGVPKKMIQDAFILSQYDELSQHHFCYVESFVAMMIDLGLTSSVPQDPRERLEYIKKIIWGLIYKYTPKSSRNTAQWAYFKKYFPYILETFGPDGKRLKMRRGYIQIPPTKGQVKYRLRKIRLRDDIDSTWSLKKIAKWAKGTKKWIKPK